jgi:hypothetical protein
MKADLVNAKYHLEKVREYLSVHESINTEELLEKVDCLVDDIDEELEREVSNVTHGNKFELLG